VQSNRSNSLDRGELQPDFFVQRIGPSRRSWPWVRCRGKRSQGSGQTDSRRGGTVCYGGLHKQDCGPSTGHQVAPVSLVRPQVLILGYALGCTTLRVVGITARSVVQLILLTVRE